MWAFAINFVCGGGWVEFGICLLFALASGVFECSALRSFHHMEGIYTITCWDFRLFFVFFFFHLQYGAVVWPGLSSLVLTNLVRMIYPIPIMLVFQSLFAGTPRARRHDDLHSGVLDRLVLVISWWFGLLVTLGHDICGFFCCYFGVFHHGPCRVATQSRSITAYRNRSPLETFR